jgi:CheY-like chemotaxis protein
LYLDTFVAAPKPRRILVVEDDPPTREVYRLALISAGFRAAAVEDGLSALRYLETDVPDAVVLDLMLPRVGGRDVYLDLRSNPATRDLPVVIVTGTDVRNLEPTPCCHFLRKPVTPEALVEAVEHAIRSSGGPPAEPA